MNTEALKIYRAKVQSGEIIPTRPRNPYEKHKDDPKSRVKAINAKCWDCVGGQREEIRLCEITDCSLHAFRPYK